MTREEGVQKISSGTDQTFIIPIYKLLDKDFILLPMLFTILGGKWTTYRWIEQQVTDYRSVASKYLLN